MKKLYAEIYYNKANTKEFSSQGPQKVIVVCEKPDIKCVYIPEGCENVSYINFYENVENSSEKRYLNLRYLIGKSVDINDIIKKDEIPLRTRLEFIGAYRSDNKTTFCETNFGYTMLSYNEKLVDNSQLNFEKTK